VSPPTSSFSVRKAARIGALAHREPVVGTRWQPLERALAWTLLAFIASLTLEWISFGGLAGGLLKPFHLLAIALIFLCLARWPASRLVLPVLRRYPGVFGAYFLFLGFVAISGVARSDPYVGRSELLRLAFYAGMSVVLTGLFLHVAGRRSQRLLIWTGAVTAAVLFIGLFASLAAQHQNPISLLAEAVAKGDPDIVSHRLFRIAFRSHEDFGDVGANLRHKVFSAVLLAVFVGLACAAGVARRRRTKVALGLSSLFGFGLVLLSLSRWLAICLVVTLLLVPLRVLVRGRARPAQVGMLGLALVAAAAFVLSPIGGLVVSHFGDTQSYQSRASAASSGFFAELQDATVFGAHKASVEKSPHNLVLDAWLAGGMVGAACILVFLVSYAHVWLRELRRYLTDGPGWVLPVGQLWLLGIGLIPLVRTMTAGNGLHMVEWTAVGIFLGFSYANRRQARAAASAPPPAAGAAPGPPGGDGLPLEHPQPGDRAATPPLPVGPGR
jgi:hypothetical protein